MPLHIYTCSEEHDRNKPGNLIELNELRQIITVFRPKPACTLHALCWPKTRRYTVHVLQFIKYICGTTFQVWSTTSSFLVSSIQLPMRSSPHTTPAQHAVSDTHRISYPKWIIGPSGPTGRPDATAKMQEKNLTTIVLTLNMAATAVPFRNPISSGMPEPAAAGRSTYHRVQQRENRSIQ